jgi:hypothetical protein
MRDFTREFRANPVAALNWPGAASGVQVTEEFGLFARVLLEAARTNLQASTVNVTTSNGPLHARLVAFLEGYQNPGGSATLGWPVKDATLRRSGKKDVDHLTIRLWEIAVVLQELIGGIAVTAPAGHGGGGVPRFPPH